MIEISNIDATIISRDLNELKSLVIKNPNFIDYVDDILDRLRSEIHCVTINGHNFRRSMRILRNMNSSAKQTMEVSQIDTDRLISLYLNAINPMLKALNDYVIDKPTKEEENEIKLVQARNRLLYVEKITNDESDDDEETDDIDVEQINQQVEKEIEKSTIGHISDVEKNLRKSLYKGLKVKTTSDNRGLDVQALLRANKITPEEKHKDVIEDTGNKPFSELSKLLDTKMSEVKKKEVNLKELVLQSGIDCISNLDEKQKKKLLKLLPKENKELMVNSEQFLVDQLNIIKEYDIKNYRIPRLDNDEEFKVFTAPIFAVTSPYFSSEKLKHIKGLSARLIFPGWLLDKQVVATIPTSIYKDEKAFNALVEKIRSLLHNSTEKRWTHVSEGAEFKLKGFSGQTFLWFVPNDWFKYLDTFSVDSVEFPFYMTRDNKADSNKLKALREERQKGIENLLRPYYNKVDKMFKVSDELDKSIAENKSKFDSLTLKLDNLSFNSCNMKVLLQQKQEKNKLELIRDKLELWLKKRTAISNKLVKKANSWDRQLGKLEKELSHSKQPLSEVDLSFFTEED